jgi:hypothetical protein
MRAASRTLALGFVLFAGFFGVARPTAAQFPPFSYRGVYESILPSGSRIVFFVRENGHVIFGFFGLNNQLPDAQEFAVEPNGTFSFSSTAGVVSGTFTPTSVSGFLGSQAFAAQKTSLNSVQGSKQGGYSGWLWFQPGGSLGGVVFVLMPTGTFYALAATVSGLQAAVGSWSESGAFSGTSIPGNTSASGFATLTDGMFEGSYSVPGFGQVFFRATKENLTYRLINISTRGFVGTGDGQMIAGFVIRNGAKRVLLRVLGPSLTALQVSGAISDPFLTLFSGQTAIATNDNWRVGNDVNAINATGLGPPDDRDCALLVTLEEGPYTAIVRGANGETGVALVEVNEID